MKSIYFIIIIIVFSFTISCKKHYDPMFVVSTDGIMLREKAEQTSNSIAKIPFGEKVNIISQTTQELFIDGEYGKWIEIEWSGKRGWSFSGFLRDYDIVSLKDHIAKYYNDYYKSNKAKDDLADNNLEDYPKLFNHKSSDIGIESIKGNFIVFSYLFPSKFVAGDYWRNSAIWIYENKSLKQFLDYPAILLYLNNDKYVDAMIFKLHGDGDNQLLVFLGVNDYKMNKVIDNHTDFTGGDIRLISQGQCSKTSFKYLTSDNGYVAKYYSFDCNNNTFTLSKIEKLNY